MKKLSTNLLMAILGGIVAILIYKSLDNKTVGLISDPKQGIEVVPASYTLPVPVMGPDFVEAADLSVHAVVHIKAEWSQRTQTYDNFFDLFNDFFGNPHQKYYYNQPVIATGSGVIISDDGYIVTNNHVVQEAEKLEVTLNDNRSFEAKIIGTDPSTDLALIKIESSGLPSLEYGDSDNLRVGEWVLAVGNPFNLTSTVTAGIVSAKARNINILGARSAIESFIQTDAVVNRGNSGGALVNTDGDLVGINAAIASNTGSYTGYSFAIPVNIVKKVIGDFMEYGEVQRAYLGITFREVDSKFAEDYDLDEANGVYIAEILEGSGARKAGLEAGDVIVKIDNTKINSKSSLLETIGTKRPGDIVKVFVVRDHKLKEFDVELKNISGNTEIIKNNRIELLGASFVGLSEEEKAELNIDHGLKIVELVSGKFKSSGIREGFIVMSIDKEPVETVQDLHIVLNGKTGGTLVEGIYPNGQRAYYGLGL
ncbi:MAG: Do family serine endopeptidase [Chlorobi bacterium]|nr:Do family serine endopeptidase [Chlorobiota bacterium]